MIKFFNTYSGTIEPFVPLKPPKVGLYTCGPTVYDYAHIGNYRAYMFEDLLKRFLQFMGFEVIHVMNITDIEDKIIRQAQEKKISINQYTEKYIAAFFSDIDTLHISRADYYPRATEHIMGMARMVKGLHEKGYAYEKDGSYYFNIAAFPAYGKLAKIKQEDLKTGVRIDSDEYEKESVQDFALWKARKADEPYWDTEIGEGRPGWHIECSVMSAKYLGESFDIHCGGVDNIFPHHENEIAQSEAYTGKRFVRYWLHCQHLIRDGEKMSKSRGNTVTVEDLVKGRDTDPAALRLLLLSTHYRKLLNFTDAALQQAVSSLQRLRDFYYELQNKNFASGSDPEVKKLIATMRDKFTAGLSDDLNISVSLTAVFELIRQINVKLARNQLGSQDAQELIAELKDLDRILAVLPPEEETSLSDKVQLKIAERETARKNKDYALADRIRDELLALGIILEDTKDGVRWKLRN